MIDKIVKLQSSDEELPAEEEAEVMRLQREKAKFLSMEDFGIEDANQDESDGEPTMEVSAAHHLLLEFCLVTFVLMVLCKNVKLKSLLVHRKKTGVMNQDPSHDKHFPLLQEIMVKGKTTSKSLADEEAKDDTGTAYEEIKKDLNALSKEEQMDVVYRLAFFSHGVSTDLVF